MTQHMPMPDRLFPATCRRVAGSALAVLGVLAGCASPNHRAPVEDRRPAVVPAPASVPAPVASSEAVVAKPTPLPGAENAGRPGYYTVKPGDTLIRIGLEHGQNWRDVARWNGLENANVIEVGQVLRVVPPSADASAVVVKMCIRDRSMTEVPGRSCLVGEMPGNTYRSRCVRKLPGAGRAAVRLW